MAGSPIRPSTVAANSATRCDRTTAGSGSYTYRPTGPTGATATPDPVREAPDGRTVARRGTDASGPHQNAASTRSPPTDTHSPSAPGGSSAWSIPGANFSTVRGTRAGSPAMKSQGGDHDRGSSSRPRPPRRAGSANTASYRPTSTVVASAQATVTFSPSTSALAAATAAVSGSASTAKTEIPCRAAARASAPTPQPRSARVRTPA